MSDISGADTFQDVPLAGSAAYPGIKHSVESYKAYADYLNAYADYLKTIYPDERIQVIQMEYFHREVIL